MGPSEKLVDGFISGVAGFVIVYILPNILPIFYQLNSPWYLPILYALFVLAALIGEVVNGVVGSFAYLIGFIFGAWAVHDWTAIGLVLLLSLGILYLKMRSDRSDDLTDVFAPI